MSKLALTNLANLQNETTAVNAINANNAAIIAAVDNTVSRNGAIPDQMLATLDMNSNHIINLPSPTTPNEPLREQDLIDFLAPGHLTVNNFGIIEFDTLALATAASISVGQNSAKINGYTSAGDGGAALYKRVGSQPSHAGGKFQSADGGWWEIAEPYINVLQFGAKGDGVTNDTTAIQNAINYVQASVNLTSRKLYFPATTSAASSYRVTNLVTNGIITLQGDGPQHSVIKALAGGSTNYLIAPQAYVNNGAFSDPPVRIQSLSIDGNGIRDNVVVIHGYDVEILDNYIYNCTASTGTNIFITSLGINGTTDGGGGSGVKIIGNYIGYGLNSAGYQIRVKNPTLSYTDVMIFDNTLQTANYGLYAPRPDGWLAGWQICRNHFFLCNTFDLYGWRTGISTTISENYFESNVKIETGNISIGPNNTFYNNTINGRLDVYFPEDNSPFHSSNNNFGPSGYINHFGTTANHKIYSKNDNFNIPLAYRWGTLAATSTSKIYAVNSYNANTNKLMNGMATGVTGETTNGPVYDSSYINDDLIINAVPSATFIRGNSNVVNLTNNTQSVAFLSAQTAGVFINAAVPLVFSGVTSGTISIAIPAVAGIRTLTLPAATDTLVGKATTDTFTNKTFDTAGTGNSFSINGTAVTADTGLGPVARQQSPSFVTPFLNVASATSINKVTITAPATTATLTILNNKTFTVNNTITLAGTDGQTYTLPSTTGSVMTADSTNTLTNKTYDTAGTGNSFSINSVAATGNTGTGLVARQNTPSFITPSLGDATVNTVNKVTITQPASSATLTIANTKALTISNTMTLAGTDSSTYTFPGASATIPDIATGTWTPTIQGSTTAGTGQTYSTQYGSYEKLGRLVIARFSITATSVGTAAGNVLIGGFPFTFNGTAGEQPVCSIAYIVAGLAASNFSLLGIANGSADSSRMPIYQTNSTGIIALTMAQGGNTATYIGTVVYRT